MTTNSYWRERPCWAMPGVLEVTAAVVVCHQPWFRLWKGWQLQWSPQRTDR